MWINKRSVAWILWHFWFQLQRMSDWLTVLFIRGQRKKIRILLGRKRRRLEKILSRKADRD